MLEDIFFLILGILILFMVLYAMLWAEGIIGTKEAGGIVFVSIVIGVALGPTADFLIFGKVMSTFAGVVTGIGISGVIGSVAVIACACAERTRQRNGKKRTWLAHRH